MMGHNKTQVIAKDMSIVNVWAKIRRGCQEGGKCIQKFHCNSQQRTEKTWTCSH